MVSAMVFGWCLRTDFATIHSIATFECSHRSLLTQIATRGFSTEHPLPGSRMEYGYVGLWGLGNKNAFDKRSRIRKHMAHPCFSAVVDFGREKGTLLGPWRETHCFPVAMEPCR